MTPSWTVFDRFWVPSWKPRSVKIQSGSPNPAQNHYQHLPQIVLRPKDKIHATAQNHQKIGMHCSLLCIVLMQILWAILPGARQLKSLRKSCTCLLQNAQFLYRFCRLSQQGLQLDVVGPCAAYENQHASIPKPFETHVCLGLDLEPKTADLFKCKHPCGKFRHWKPPKKPIVFQTRFVIVCKSEVGARSKFLQVLQPGIGQGQNLVFSTCNGTPLKILSRPAHAESDQNLIQFQARSSSNPKNVCGTSMHNLNSQSGRVNLIQIK